MDTVAYTAKDIIDIIKLTTKKLRHDKTLIGFGLNDGIYKYKIDLDKDQIYNKELVYKYQSGKNTGLILDNQEIFIGVGERPLIQKIKDGKVLKSIEPKYAEYVHKLITNTKDKLIAICQGGGKDIVNIFDFNLNPIDNISFSEQPGEFVNAFLMNNEANLVAVYATSIVIIDFKTKEIDIKKQGKGAQISRIGRGDILFALKLNDDTFIIIFEDKTVIIKDLPGNVSQIVDIKVEPKVGIYSPYLSINKTLYLFTNEQILKYRFYSGESKTIFCGNNCIEEAQDIVEIEQDIFVIRDVSGKMYLLDYTTDTLSIVPQQVDQRTRELFVIPNRDRVKSKLFTNLIFLSTQKRINMNLASMVDRFV
jgi:hypothetical protein